MTLGTGSDTPETRIGGPNRAADLSRVRPRVLVTLPVYNEAPILNESVENVISALTDSRVDFTLVIAEDGSTDGSQECIRKIVEHHPSIIVQSVPEKHGRGWALNNVWSRFEADIYAFSDTDFAAEPECLITGIRLVQEGQDVVTGSRYVAGARVIRPPLRHLVSRFYNRLIRMLFQDRVRDHQCGLKVFSSAAVRALVPLSREDSWFWDTEMLILANDSNLVVTEFPVDWIERKVLRTELWRLASDFYLHGKGMLRLAGDRRTRGYSHRAWTPTDKLPRRVGLSPSRGSAVTESAELPDSG